MTAWYTKATGWLTAIANANDMQNKVIVNAIS